MFKLFLGIFSILLALFNPASSLAAGSSFVTIVNPVRGPDFWNLKNQKPADALRGELGILQDVGLKATWLIRFDALQDAQIINILKNVPNGEKGIFLEVTPEWAKAAGISYHNLGNWHGAGSAFLSGYEQEERIKLLDSALGKFKEIFGFYPKSVGAWWVDSFSLQYLQQKYGITASLEVSDQYTTDNYQIWGQYWSTPYYPSKNYVLHPAQTEENKLPVVIMQWAARDPLNGYGNGVEESTYSVQPNDYIDYHHLTTGYFAKLINIYTKQPLNKFGQVVVGLENSYSWDKYKQEYGNQMRFLSDKQKSGQLQVVTMEDFASVYMSLFPKLSPSQAIVADDPLGSSKKVIWFMNPYYRTGLFFQKDGVAFRDIRQYVDGQEEPCLHKACNEINFATSASRVLDDVSFGQRLMLDEGKISGFEIKESADGYRVSYKNEAGKVKTVDFLPRDISIDGKTSSIDTTILEATKNSRASQTQTSLKTGAFKWSPFSALINILKFGAFLLLVCLVPGSLLLDKFLPKEMGRVQKNTLSTVTGFCTSTFLFYILGLIKLRQAILVYLFINLIILVRTRKQIFAGFSFGVKDKLDPLITAVILAGTIFQSLPVFRSGLNFAYGLGLWGPNTHDGLWHISLINSLIKGVPPQNPVFAGNVLKNYHYFYDLLIALTSYLTKISVLDLVFRFYPVIFSLILGISSYYLLQNFTKNKLAASFSLYLIYFAGSFGWIVEFIKQRHLGGESAFWANQSISFNLNPPFAVSLLIVIAILQLMPFIRKNWWAIFALTILSGTLISFKAYAAVLILGTLPIAGIIKRNLYYIYVFVLSSAVSVLLLLSNFNLGQQLLIFSPFWFINSMIDSPDRVGWARLSLARTVGLSSRNWFKLIAAEFISLIIFVFGNLGIRFLAFFSLVKIKEIYENSERFFLFVFSMLALLIPIFFIQAGNPWNTIQFIYYFLYVSALVGGIILARIKFLPLLILLLIITPINSWSTANGYLTNQPHAYLSGKELAALDFLRTQPDGIVLTYPYDSGLKNTLAQPWPLVAYDSTAYVSALSAKEVFIEDEPQNQILLTDYKKRLLRAKDFFSGSSASGEKILAQGSIKYIYLPKIFHIRVDESLPGIKNIFENDEAVIYKYTK